MRLTSRDEAKPPQPRPEGPLDYSFGAATAGGILGSCCQDGPERTVTELLIASRSATGVQRYDRLRARTTSEARP